MRRKATKLEPCTDGVKKNVRMAVLVTCGSVFCPNESGVGSNAEVWTVPVTAPLGVNSNRMTSSRSEFSLASATPLSETGIHKRPTPNFEPGCCVDLKTRCRNRCECTTIELHMGIVNQKTRAAKLWKHKNLRPRL